MTIDEIIGFVTGFEGVLTVRPGPGDGSPEISWGDTFFYHAPDGVLPERTQPFATIVTKDYPGDEGSRLDRPEVFRVNIAAGREAFVRWTGHAPREAAGDEDFAALDTVLAHPVHGAAGWLAVVCPGQHSGAATRELLARAHHLARARRRRRAGAEAE
ncbi:DUF6194 family protein [Streptomyces sp. NPDC059740]|uniref:DUF6194 family protein n=1 Tax=Streptomyces sp. NPDC059740 TaxID=3346926 RepID=UPI0036512E6B